MAALTLCLLGGFDVWVGSEAVCTALPKKAQALLVFLALQPEQRHSREKLATLLWGNSPSEQARHSLRQTLFGLRKALPLGVLVFDGEQVSLARGAVDVDVSAFLRSMERGTPTSLHDAASRYRGDLLDGVVVDEPAFEEWLRGERQRLHEAAVVVLERLLEHQQAAGTRDGAIQTAVRLLALDALREPIHRALMRLYAAKGRLGDALRQYRVCVDILRREMQVDPEPATRALYAEILQQNSRGGAGRMLTRRPSRTRAPRRVGGLRLGRPEWPLIGRDRELTRLREALVDATSGRGRVVAIVGDAGIGKTRLLEEVVREATERHITVAAGRSYETEQILPFSPWVDVLRAGLAAPRTNLARALDRVWMAELARLIPELAVPGADAGTAEDHRRLFEAVLRFVVHLATRRPVLVVLEDLQWADEMSLRLLAYLGRRLDDRRVLIVGSLREEELATADHPANLVLQELERDRRLVRLTLGPLARPETEALVRVLAAHVARDLRAQLASDVWTASEGNPLLIVETVRAVEENGAAQAPGTLPLSLRVREVIESRLARLDPRYQNLAIVAAVIGRELDPAVLRLAGGLDEGQTASGLEELVRRRVLRAVGEHLDFTHDRLREALYVRLSAPGRRLLHAAVARALEQVYAADLPTHCASLGFHYSEAGLWREAATHLHRAGMVAAARGAHTQAVIALERTLEALQRVPEDRERDELAVDARLALRNSLFYLGEYDRVEQCLLEAEALAHALGDRSRLGRISLYLCDHFRRRGDADRAMAHGRAALDIAATVGDLELRTQTNLYLGQLHNSLGDVRVARDLLRKNLEALTGEDLWLKFGQPMAVSVASRAYLVVVEGDLGEFAHAIPLGEEAVRIAEDGGQPFDVCDACLGLGALYVKKGDFEKAIPLLERARELCETWSIRLLLQRSLSTLGRAYALSGRIAEGLPLLEQAAEASAVLRGRSVGHSLWLIGLCEGHLLADQVDAARPLAERLLEVARSRSERGYEAHALRLLGDVAVLSCPPATDEADRYYRASIALAERLGMRPLAALGRLRLSELLARLSPEAGRTGLETALHQFAGMEMTFWVRRAEEAIAGKFHTG